MQRLQPACRIAQQHQPPQHLFVALLLWQPVGGSKVGQRALVTKLLKKVTSRVAKQTSGVQCC
jgi:hypothetical protein